MTYTAIVIDPPGVRINEFAPMIVDPADLQSQNILMIAPYAVFEDGEVLVKVKITDDQGKFEHIHTYKMAGPMSMPKEQTDG